MSFRIAILCSFAIAAAPALAQTDAGVIDAGEPDPCDPSCEADGLHFCDGEAPSVLPCATPFARCGELSAAWGADCLLAAGATCDPGYAFGDSRCDRAASLFCIEGTCQVASTPEAPGPLVPSAGTSVADTSSATNDPFACSSCGTSSALGLFCFGGALRGLRRTRRAVRPG